MRRSKRRSAIGQLVTVPEVFAKVKSAQKQRKYIYKKKTNEGIELQRI